MEQKRGNRMSKTVLIAEPGQPEIVLIRVFEAPRELVFQAQVDPELIPLWWGPASLTTTVEKLEARPGGQWRFVQRDPEGNEYAFHGVFHTVQPPERLVFTFEYEGTPGHVLLETLTFEEQDGLTKMTDQSVFQSVADRDGMLSAGMAGGANESVERLSKLLVEAAARVGRSG